MGTCIILSCSALSRGRTAAELGLQQLGVWIPFAFSSCRPSLLPPVSSDLIFLGNILTKIIFPYSQ